MALALITGIGVYDAYLLVADNWIAAVLLGVGFPVAGVYEWSRLRKQVSAHFADQLLGWIITAQVGFTMIAESPDNPSSPDCPPRERVEP